jgi:hypothetical protein
LGTCSPPKSRGTITDGNATSAKVSISGKLTPAVGDDVEIFFKLAGADEGESDRGSVARGKVVARHFEVITVRIESAIATVAKGQRVRFISGSTHNGDARRRVYH